MRWLPSQHWTNSCTLDETAGWQESAAGSEGNNPHCAALIHHLALLRKKTQLLLDLDKLAACKTDILIAVSIFCKKKKSNHPGWDINIQTLL